LTKTKTKAIVIATDPVADELFCGRTLVERHHELLRRAGVSDVSIERSRTIPVPGEMSEGDRVLRVTAERIFDPRLYALALAYGSPVRIVDEGTPIGLDATMGAQPQAALDVRGAETYSRELRRRLPPFWMRVASRADRRRVTRLLVDASGKGHQDLPALLINAPIEKAAMRLLANTRVTPNQITVVCNLLAYGVAALLASGHLLAGALGALVVGVVDGLDGRQARVQVRTTSLGRIEHLLDKAYEILWMVALAYALSAGFENRWYVTALLVWLAAYLIDTAAYDLVKWKTGITLDESSSLDACIRLVAGRRNVYACILLVSIVAGQAEAGFRVIVWWAAMTAAVHAFRAGICVLRARSMNWPSAENGDARNQEGTKNTKHFFKRLRGLRVFVVGSRT
jgi:phosphatidylglycerophosphate synthase